MRVASIPIVGACLALMFPLLYIFAIQQADHIGTFFKAVFALCALVSGAFAMSDARKVWRIFNTPGDWKTTIGAGRLMWDVAIPCSNLPMDIALGDITKTLLLEISRTGTDSDGEYTETSERFELHLTDDRVLTFDREAAGINPHRVFLALANHGIRYELWSQDRTKASVNRSRIYQRTY
jgi:hypothetical protein